MNEQQIAKLKERVGYNGKSQQWQYGFDLVCRELQGQLEADKWIRVEDRLPEPLRNVLVLIDDNSAKNANQMVANFIPKFTEEASCEEWSEYCEEKDLFYCPQGWYANTTYIGDEYASYFIDEKVTHWQQLPEPPTVQEGE